MKSKRPKDIPSIQSNVTVKEMRLTAKRINPKRNKPEAVKEMKSKRKCSVRRARSITRTKGKLYLKERMLVKVFVTLLLSCCSYPFPRGEVLSFGMLEVELVTA
jgi:hypothetical protein